MKVLFLSHQAEFMYGGEIVTLAFMRELRQLGVEIHFASPPGPYLDRAREVARGHELSSKQFSRRLSQLPGLAAAWWRTRAELAELVERHGIQIVHATSLKAMVYAWALGRKIPAVWHHHDILPATLSNRVWLHAIASRARLILTPSAATREALVEAGVHAEKVQVLANGFRIGEWQARVPREENQPLKIGVVGEISPRKGTDRLEEILKHLGNFSVEISVIGEGLSDPEFAARLRQRLESPRVKFLGRREVKSLYQEMDLLLVPSRQDPLPTVIVEAGLSGVPIVGARAGGIPEMIRDGENGFLFRNEQEAAEAIRKTKTQWQELARNSRRMAEEKYDISRLAKTLLVHYKSLMGGGQKTDTDTLGSR